MFIFIESRALAALAALANYLTTVRIRQSLPDVVKTASTHRVIARSYHFKSVLSVHKRLSKSFNRASRR